MCPSARAVGAADSRATAATAPSRRLRRGDTRCCRTRMFDGLLGSGPVDARSGSTGTGWLGVADKVPAAVGARGRSICGWVGWRGTGRVGLDRDQLRTAGWTTRRGKRRVANRTRPAASNRMQAAGRPVLGSQWASKGRVEAGRSGGAKKKNTCRHAPRKKNQTGSTRRQEARKKFEAARTTTWRLGLFSATTEQLFDGSSGGTGRCDDTAVAKGMGRPF